MIPRIVLTGYADKENAIKRLNELDLFYYVEKPWKPDQLDKLILLALQKHRQNRIEAMFRRYVPYEIIEEHVDQSEESLLIGNEQEATIMFLDIAGFTPMAEKMQPKEVVTLLNNYLSAMVEIIGRHNGMVDKFTGDGLIAFYKVSYV